MDQLAVICILGEGLLVADALWRGIRNNRPVVLAAGEAVQGSSVIPEQRTQVLFAQSGDIADGAKPFTGKLFGRFFSYSPQPSDGEWSQKGQGAAGFHNHQAVGLFQIRGDLGQVFILGHSHRCDKARSFSYAFLDSTGNRRSATEQTNRPCDIQECLIDAQRFHQIGELPEVPENLIGNILIAGHAGPHEYPC